VPHGHIHISAFMTDRDYNFTHRINKFSFGGPSPGIVHPLEGDEKIADNSKFVLSCKKQADILNLIDNFSFRYDALSIFC